MKKSFIIYTMLLSASCFIGYSSQAQQQQKKPSERSFTAEMEKVKQIQAVRNVKISQMPQPSANTAVADNNNKQTTVIVQNQTINPGTATPKTQPVPAKPSSGEMKLPKKPVSKG